MAFLYCFMLSGVLFLIVCTRLFVCACAFGAIHDPQFEEQQQDQGFGGPDQFKFEEDKWTLDHVFDP